MCATVLMVVPVYPVSVVTSPLLFMGAVRPIVFQKKTKKYPANALFDIRVCLWTFSAFHFANGIKYFA